MKFRKLGKIFDPTEHKLPNDCHEYAQAPQTLIGDDFVRIYFSTRSRDPNGRYRSHVAFVEFDKDLKKVIKVSSHTIVPLGDLGCYDEHGIFPFNILQHEDKVFGFIGGINRRLSVSVDSSIGLSTSSDNGLSFIKAGPGPVLTSSHHEPFLICDPFVMVIDGDFHMWYSYGIRWMRAPGTDNPERVYKIGHAVSKDAIHWRKEGRQIIMSKIDQNECQALPTVLRHQDSFHMFFCYRNAFGFRSESKKGYRIGYAYSNDLQNWTRKDSLAGIDVSDKGWDSEMVCYPHIFKHSGDVFLLYNGNEFGRYGFGLAVLEN